MRRDHKMLIIVEVSDVIGCDTFELGLMIKRVVYFLGLKLPEFDIAGLLERAVKTCVVFNGLSEGLIRRMLKQGVFLVQCSMKWYLTTGRKPMPVVAAVLVFVSEVNGIEVKIKHLAVRTCRKRYKEIVQRLVKVAQALPWGKDIAVKNIVKNATFVMHYMELKSMVKEGERSLEPVEFDLDDVLNDCFSKKGSYNLPSVQAANESRYFDVEYSGILRIEGPDNTLPLLSHESLAWIYSTYLEEIALVKSSAEKGTSHTRMNRTVFDFRACGEWWTGKSELSKKLLFEQILEKDIGLNANPPSFDQGCLKYQIRKDKIKAAKLRIERIMHPSKPGSGNNDSHSIGTRVGKKRKKREVEIDWEDFIIVTLLLHQVKEEEIAKGH